MSRFKAIDLTGLKTYSIKNRSSKVDITAFSKPYDRKSKATGLWDAIPNVLIGKDLRELVNDIVAAKRNGKPVILMMGAHVIKCGLNPLVIQLMNEGIIQCIAMNGACVIHDTETAFWGNTSEDVSSALDDGRFGMVKETPEIINNALKQGSEKDMGYGESIAWAICESEASHSQLSILAASHQCKIPVTVHVAIGTDITHQHENSEGATIGTLSYRDFKIFCDQISRLGNGGVLLNFGSAVILPEVFLKALSVARNLGHDVHHFTTANFDMIRHYRPQVNVVQRPTQTGGRGFHFTGHHEIMMPLLVSGIMDNI
ncbi:MAG: hypothetical protein V2J62_05175 [candidate division KSB1 bacterium]|jgi:hypothetical protein|nr:hypothetical protein [candidate division KSB1 bacterium]